MGFYEKSPEYQACVKFLKTIRPQDRTDTTEIVDLVSPAESPAKSTDIDVYKLTKCGGKRDDSEEQQEKQNNE